MLGKRQRDEELDENVREQVRPHVTEQYPEIRYNMQQVAGDGVVLKDRLPEWCSAPTAIPGEEQVALIYMIEEVSDQLILLCHYKESGARVALIVKKPTFAFYVRRKNVQLQEYIHDKSYFQDLCGVPFEDVEHTERFTLRGYEKDPYEVVKLVVHKQNHFRQAKKALGDDGWELYNTTTFNRSLQFQAKHKITTCSWIRFWGKRTPTGRHTWDMEEWELEGLSKVESDEIGYFPILCFDLETRFMPYTPIYPNTNIKRTGNLNKFYHGSGIITHTGLAQKTHPSDPVSYHNATCIVLGQTEGMINEKHTVTTVDTEGAVIVLTMLGIHRGSTVLTGYNIDNFDTNWLQKRARQLFQTEEELKQELAVMYRVQKINWIQNATPSQLLHMSSENQTRRVEAFLMEFRRQLHERRVFRQEYCNMGILAHPSETEQFKKLEALLETCPDPQFIYFRLDQLLNSFDGCAYHGVKHILDREGRSWTDRLTYCRGSVYEAILTYGSRLKDGYINTGDKGIDLKIYHNVSDEKEYRAKNKFILYQQPAHRCYPVTGEFGSKIRGKSGWSTLKMPGFLMWDLMRVLKKNPMINPGGYGLKFIADKLFGVSVEINYEHLPKIAQATLNGWVRGNTAVTRYCISDVTTVFDIDKYYGQFMAYMGMARTVGVDVSSQLGGQTRLCNSLYYRKAELRGFMFPLKDPKLGNYQGGLLVQRTHTGKVTYVHYAGDPLKYKLEEPGEPVHHFPDRLREKYKGALVFPPEAGYYCERDFFNEDLDMYEGDGVGVLDFASLYPSIVQEGNIGPSTKIIFQPGHLDERLQELGLTRDQVRPSHHPDVVFVKSEVRVSLISEICTDAKRNRAIFKKIKANHGKIVDFISSNPDDLEGYEQLLKETQVEFPLEGEDRLEFHQRKHANADNRQSTEKLVGNGMYGYLGAKFGPMVDFHVAEEITRSGERYITMSAQVVVDFARRGAVAVKNKILRKRLKEILDMAKQEPNPMLVRSGDVGKCPFGLDNMTFQEIMDTTWERCLLVFKDIHDHYNSENYEEDDDSTEIVDTASKRINDTKKRVEKRNRQLGAGSMSINSFFGGTVRDDSRNEERNKKRQMYDDKFQPLFMVPAKERPGTGYYKAVRFADLWCRTGRKPVAISWEELELAVDDVEEAKRMWTFLDGKFTEQELEELEPHYVFHMTAQIVYGDTDSVMAMMKKVPRVFSHYLFYKMELVLNIYFAATIYLVQEYENLLYGIWMKKKRYVTFKRANKQEKGKLYMKGVENKRGDGCKLRSDVLTELQKKMVKDQLPAPDILKYLQKQLDDLAEGKVPICDIIIRAGLSKPIGDYESISPHVAVALRRAKLGEDLGAGDRIPYIFRTVEDPRRGTSNCMKASERSMDPVEALQLGIKPDYEYYIEKQLKTPVYKFLQYMVNMKKVRKMFADAKKKAYELRSRNPYTEEEIKRSGAFVVNVCRVCREQSDSSVCANPECQAKLPSLIEVATSDVEREQIACDSVWEKCNVCPSRLEFGMAVEDCNATDCPNWAMRLLAKKSLNGAQTCLEKLRVSELF